MTNPPAAQPAAAEPKQEPAPPPRVCVDCGRDVGPRETMRQKGPKQIVCEECYTDDHAQLETIPDPLSATNRAPSGGEARRERRR